MKGKTVIAGLLVASVAACSSGGSQRSQRDAEKGWCGYATGASSLELATNPPKNVTPAQVLKLVKGYNNPSTPPKIRPAVVDLIAGVKAIKEGKPASQRTIVAASTIDHFVLNGCKGGK